MSLIIPPGVVKTTRPNSDQPYGIPWGRVNDYEPAFANAGAEFGVDPHLLVAMAVVESDITHYGRDGRAIERWDAFPEDGPSVGIMQVKPQIHRWRIPGCLPYLPADNIRLAATIMASAIERLGSWQKALVTDYFPDDDPNGTTQNAYVRTVHSLLNEMRNQMPTVRFAGALVPVSLDVPYRYVELPKTQTYQRPGTKMTPKLYVQHETGNPGAGADAEAHLNYLQQGAPDRFGRAQQLGYHLTVDADEVIQMIPLDEIAWHGGDGGGPCNMTGIACELTVENNNANKAKARANAEKVAAAVMTAMNLTRLEQHNFCSGKDCPHYIRADGYWPVFKENVQRLIDGTSAPAFAGLPDWLPAEYFQAAFPSANPGMPVTAKVIEVINDLGVVPIFLGKIDVAPNKNIWQFDEFTLLNDGNRVWREGEK